MTEHAQLIIRLRVDGSIEAETKQIHGEACVPFASILEDLCDAEAIDSNYSQDYYVTSSTDEQIERGEQRDNA